jgi:hypothetical protein
MDNRLYLDNCAFNRPYDDQTLLKNYLEAEAKTFIKMRTDTLVRNEGMKALTQNLGLVDAERFMMHGERIGHHIQFPVNDLGLYIVIPFQDIGVGVNGIFCQ